MLEDAGTVFTFCKISAVARGNSSSTKSRQGGIGFLLMTPTFSFSYQWDYLLAKHPSDGHPTSVLAQESENWQVLMGLTSATVNQESDAYGVSLSRSPLSTWRWVCTWTAPLLSRAADNSLRRGTLVTSEDLVERKEIPSCVGFSQAF